jgi:hypothetical protein
VKLKKEVDEQNEKRQKLEKEYKEVSCRALLHLRGALVLV